MCLPREQDYSLLVSRKSTLWILEDDEALQELYRDILATEGELRFFFAQKDLFEAWEESPLEKRPDLVLADLSVRDGSFVDYLKKARDEGGVPFQYLIVTGFDDLEALKLSFDTGAHDYITKPFGKNELLMKVRKILTEVTPDVRLDATSFRLIRGSRQSEPLTSREFQIITLFKQAPERTLPKEDLYRKIWNETQVINKTLDVHIFNLRKKIQPLGVEIRFSQPNLYSMILR